MSFLKGLGQVTGEVAGRVVGGSVRVVGELAGSKFVKEIGDSVENASIKVGRTAGEFASGVYDTAAGTVQNDKDRQQAGLQDMGNAASDTAKGAVDSAKYVYNSGKELVEGISEDDRAKIRSGAKGVVLAAATAALAVGVIDIVDGPDGT
ncbi:hypothetical protein EBB07_22485 [Paenibacillaceae bacterium]|nr:hypothetical protein EBB07_22485 [Paenibacillaceae bacterium]